MIIVHVIGILLIAAAYFCAFLAGVAHQDEEVPKGTMMVLFLFGIIFMLIGESFSR